MHTNRSECACRDSENCILTGMNIPSGVNGRYENSPAARVVSNMRIARGKTRGSRARGRKEGSGRGSIWLLAVISERPIGIWVVGPIFEAKLSNK